MVGGDCPWLRHLDGPVEPVVRASSKMDYSASSCKSTIVGQSHPLEAQSPFRTQFIVFRTQYIASIEDPSPPSSSIPPPGRLTHTARTARFLAFITPHHPSHPISSTQLKNHITNTNEMDGFRFGFISWNTTRYFFLSSLSSHFHSSHHHRHPVSCLWTCIITTHPHPIVFRIASLVFPTISRLHRGFITTVPHQQHRQHRSTSHSSRPSSVSFLSIHSVLLLYSYLPLSSHLSLPSPPMSTYFPPPPPSHTAVRASSCSAGRRPGSLILILLHHHRPRLCVCVSRFSFSFFVSVIIRVCSGVYVQHLLEGRVSEYILTIKTVAAAWPEPGEFTRHEAVC